MKENLIILTGPTASGKTSLSIKLAKKFNGEIISADSRAIFKGIDIASAKPTGQEREGIPHWCFDLVDPGERFTAFDFKRHAYAAFDDILSRGKLPILVGGTGLYIDAVLYDYDFGNKNDDCLRDLLNEKTVNELQEIHISTNTELPENQRNKRYLIRNIENSKLSKSKDCKKHNKYNNIVVGITTDKDELRSRITSRAEHIFNSGVIEEAKNLADKFGWESEAMTTNVYPLIKQCLDGELTYEEMLEKSAIQDWRLAKKQLTFMRRNKDIIWLSLAEADKFIVQSLQN